MKSTNDAMSECLNFRQMRHLAVLVALAALLFLPCPARAYSYYETERVFLGSASGRYSLELWHHSGGYWQVDSEAGKLIKVRDRMIEQAGIVGYLNATQSAKWSIPLPANVREAIKQGRKVTAETEKNAGLYVGSQCSISGSGTVDVYAIPRFHIATSATLNSFVPGISVTIPLVSSGYGRNIYAIYGLLCFGEPGLGYFSNAQPSRVAEPYIHPSHIANRLGWLKSGSTINIRGQAVSSTGHTVGVLTLAAGGAVGLHFDFPITVNFFEEVQRLVTVEEPEDDGWNQQAPEEWSNEGQVTADGEIGDPAPTEEGQEPAPPGNNGSGDAGNSGPGDAGNGGSGGTEDERPGSQGQTEDPPPAFDPGDHLIHRAF